MVAKIFLYINLTFLINLFTSYFILLYMNGKELSPEWIEAKELERTHHVIREMDSLGADFTYKGKSISAQELLQLPFSQVKEALIETKLALGSQKILELYADRLVESDQMWHDISKNSVKGRNLQAAYVDVDVDGLTLGDFFAFNQGLNKMGDQALPFKIHPEHFVFAGVHGGQEVMELIGEYGQPTYQKIFISLDAEKLVVPDANIKRITLLLKCYPFLFILVYLGLDRHLEVPHQVPRLQA